ncbi:MAG: hypothetical protein DWQ01_00720 [Planctomycetota bacterium]|nr:MAG: hypothetical protein DWQ01_00720 [Planctomycetota bacterium]
MLEDGKLGFIDPPLGTLLEVDGVSYHIPAAGALSTGGPPVRGDIYGLSLILNPEAFQNQDGESFSLAPGKHRIRMAMFAQPVSNSQAEPQWVYSNLVEVVILDP